jgi:hypothetical protein
MAQPTPFDTMRAGLRLSCVVPTGAEPVVLEAVSQ